MLQPLQDPSKRFFDQVVMAPSYLVFKIGNIVYVKNGLTGQIEFSGTDASAVIQSAINALPSGIIFIKNGVYDITTGLIGKTGVQIFGEGFATKLRTANAITLLDLSYLENAVLSNISIEVPVTSNIYAIKLYKSKNCILDKIWLKAGKGIELTGDNCVVQNSYLEGSRIKDVGGWAIGAGGTGNKILNNEIWGWGHNAIMNGPNKGVIAHNYFHDFYDDCIDLNAVTEVVIEGNVCNKGKLDQVGFFVSLASNCQNIIIANNIIRGINHGVGIFNSKEVTIVGNRFFDPAVSASRFVSVTGASDGVIVMGNFAVAQYLAEITFASRTVLSAKIQILSNNLYGLLSPAYIAYINNAVGVIVRDNFGSIYGFENGPYITEAGDSDRNVIEDNQGHSWQYPDRKFKLYIQKVGANTIVRRNVGFITENSGTATITAGNTYVDVTHGLDITPDINRIKVTPQDNLGGHSFWVSDVTATTFRINISSADTVDHAFGWSYK